MHGSPGESRGPGPEPIRAIESAFEEIGLFGRRRGPHGPRGGHHWRGPHDDGRRGGPPVAGPHTNGPMTEDGAPAGRGARGPLAGIARGRVLDALATAGDALSISEIGERVGVDQPRASRLVQALVDAGFVRRTVDPGDARRSAILLTDAGRAALERSRATRRTAIEQALDGFSDAERERFAELLGRFAAAWPRD